MVTRKEYETYEKLKVKILVHDKSTQTEPYNTPRDSSDDESDKSEDSDSEEYEYKKRSHKKNGRKDSMQPIIILQGLPFSGGLNSKYNEYEGYEDDPDYDEGEEDEEYSE